METTTIDIEKIEKELCTQFCASIKVTQKSNNLIRIETPFFFPDGDPYQIYLRPLRTGGFRVTDLGHTLMHLSYENDLGIFRKGTRGYLLAEILLELGLNEDDGAFYLDTILGEIPESVFKLGQGITKIYDLTFLNRYRVASTFYEDLEERIINIVGEEKVTINYIETQMKEGEDYSIDFRIEGKEVPLFLFGVANKDKARLTTIILERLIRFEINFESLIVFQDFDNIPSNDSKRLMNVSGEMISSLDAKEDLMRKILKRAG